MINIYTLWCLQIIHLFLVISISYKILPLIKKENTKLLKVAFYTFLLSLGIEILQPLIPLPKVTSIKGTKFIGVYEWLNINGKDVIIGIKVKYNITDLITNVLGGIIGYIMYLILNTFTTKILNYIKNR